MINIAVVEDERVIREQIVSLIKKRLLCKRTGRQASGEHMAFQVDAYSSGEKLLASRKYYEVVFLDIQMEGLNGIETAEKIRQSTRESILIFVTGIREYVFEAFDVSAFHYLLKPVDEEKFAQVLVRALGEVENRQKQSRAQFFVKTRDKKITLNQGDILYIESRGKKVEIHTNREVIEIYAAMRDLEGQFGENFYRCHRGYLVNLAYVAEYGNDKIVLNNGEEIILAKEKYGEFVKVYMRYLKSGGVIRV